MLTCSVSSPLLYSAACSAAGCNATRHLPVEEITARLGPYNHPHEFPSFVKSTAETSRASQSGLEAGNEGYFRTNWSKWARPKDIHSLTTQRIKQWIDQLTNANTEVDISAIVDQPNQEDSFLSPDRSWRMWGLLLLQLRCPFTTQERLGSLLRCASYQYLQRVLI